MSDYEEFVTPPYDFAVRDPEGLHAGRGQHQLIIGRGNLDSIFIVSTDELVSLMAVIQERLEKVPF
jgi:hypothetical protein